MEAKVSKEIECNIVRCLSTSASKLGYNPIYDNSLQKECILSLYFVWDKVFQCDLYWCNATSNNKELITSSEAWIMFMGLPLVTRLKMDFNLRSAWGHQPRNVNTKGQRIFSDRVHDYVKHQISIWSYFSKPSYIFRLQTKLCNVRMPCALSQKNILRF